MAKSAVSILAAKRPVGGFVDCGTAWLGISSNLAQNKDGIEAGMHIPSLILFQLPSSIGSLIPKYALHNCIALRRWLANQPIKMDHVEGSGHMVLQITIRGLVFGHVALKREPVFAWKIRVQGSIEQRKETCGVPGYFEKAWSTKNRSITF